MVNVVMLSVVMLNVVMLNVIMLSVFKLNVVALGKLVKDNHTSGAPTLKRQTRRRKKVL
jgi:hypothetical protein